MMEKPVTVQYGRETWITLCLGILGALFYGFPIRLSRGAEAR